MTTGHEGSETQNILLFVTAKENVINVSMHEAKALKLHAKNYRAKEGQIARVMTQNMHNRSCGIL